MYTWSFSLILQLGIPKFLTLLDTSHHGWHLSKKTVLIAKAGTVSTLPLAVEGNGLQQRSGAGGLPLQRCKAPCKIWKRLSKAAEKLTGISVSPRILRWNIPKWMRSKTMRSIFGFLIFFSDMFFLLFALSACTGRSLFGSSCVASAMWSSVMDPGGSMWLGPQELWFGWPFQTSAPNTASHSQLKWPKSHHAIAESPATKRCSPNQWR